MSGPVLPLSGRWADHTAAALRERAQRSADRTLIAVPIGSIEQHGSHLPVDTDTRAVTAITELVAERREDVIVTPPVSFGSSPLHLPFGGTLSLRADTILAVLRDLASSITEAGFTRILFVNGHNSNKPFLSILSSELVVKGLAVAAATYYELIPDEILARRQRPHPGMDHAGELETSMMLHLAPHVVDQTALGEDAARAEADFERNQLVLSASAQIAFRTIERFPSGVIGLPGAADAALGGLAVQAAVDGLDRAIDEFLLDAQPARQGAEVAR